MRNSIFVLASIILCSASAFAEEPHAEPIDDVFNKMTKFIESRSFDEAELLLSQECGRTPSARCEYGWGRLYQEQGQTRSLEMVNAYQHFLEKSKSTTSEKIRAQRAHANSILKKYKDSFGAILIWEKEKFHMGNSKVVFSGPTTVWVNADKRYRIHFLGATRPSDVTVPAGELRRVQKLANSPPPSFTPPTQYLSLAEPPPAVTLKVDLGRPPDRTVSLARRENAVFLTTGIFFFTLGIVATGVCATREDLCGGNSQALTVLSPIFGIAPGLAMSVIGIVGLSRITQ